MLFLVSLVIFGSIIPVFSFEEVLEYRLEYLLEYIAVLGAFVILLPIWLYGQRKNGSYVQRTRGLGSRCSYLRREYLKWYDETGQKFKLTREIGSIIKSMDFKAEFWVCVTFIIISVIVVLVLAIEYMLPITLISIISTMVLCIAVIVIFSVGNIALWFLARRYWRRTFRTNRKKTDI